MNSKIKRKIIKEPEEETFQISLNDLIEDNLYGLLSQFDFKDTKKATAKTARQAFEKALFSNIYFSDENRINTFDQLITRINSDYSPVYRPYLEKVCINSTAESRSLDLSVKIALTCFALLYCSGSCRRDRLPGLVRDVWTTVDGNGRYVGCMINTTNGLFIDTIMNTVENSLDIPAYIPEEVSQALNASIGLPHFIMMRGELIERSQV